MANEKLVSVIIPVYNGERYLGEAIECVLAQDYRPIVAVIRGAKNAAFRARKNITTGIDGKGISINVAYQ